MRKVIGITIALVAVAGIAIAFTLPNKDKKPARKVGELNAKSFYDLSILNIDGGM